MIFIVFRRGENIKLIFTTQISYNTTFSDKINMSFEKNLIWRIWHDSFCHLPARIFNDDSFGVIYWGTLYRNVKRVKMVAVLKEIIFFSWLNKNGADRSTYICYWFMNRFNFFIGKSRMVKNEVDKLDHRVAVIIIFSSINRKRNKLH